MKTDSDNRDNHERKFADARLRYQFFVFTICLVASVSFWLLIKLSNEYTLSFNIPVTFINVPPGRILTGVSDSNFQITLKAQGYKLVQLRYFDTPRTIQVDLSNCNTAKDSDEMVTDLPLSPVVRKYSTALGFINEVHAIHPELVTVKMNKLFSKTVPVKFSADLTYAPQYLQFESCLLRPSVVKVFGSRRMVDSVLYAQPEIIRIHNMTESIVRNVHLNSDRQNNKPYFLPSRIQVTIPVQKFTEESIEVPIKMPIQTPGQTIKLFPDKATVSCFVAMKDYKKLDVRLFSLSAALSKSDNLFHLTVSAAPDFVRNVKVTPEKVEYLVLR